MKKLVLMIVSAILLAMAAVTVGCNEIIRIDDENGTQVSNVHFTPCVQNITRSAKISNKVDVEFTNEGVKITYYNFEVACDFSDVNVRHTFVNGFLNISQQGTPNQADCVCYTDVSYTISGISQREVNVIFINGEQVYCYNDNGNDDCIDLKMGEVTDIKSGETACNEQYGLSLRVEKIDDGRCNFENVVCVWAGNATVQLHLTTKNGQYDFTLDTHPGGSFVNDITIEGIKYSLVTVLPERRVRNEEQPINTARILVEKGGVDIVKSDIKYIRSGSYLGISYESGKPPYFSGSGRFYWDYYDYFVLKTDTERDDYIARMKVRLDARGLKWEFTGGPQLASVLNEYNDIFFRDYNLVMVLLTEGSGGNRHEVEAADVKNNELNILIKRDPRGVTADIAYWHILIPIKKDCFDGNIVNVNIVNVF